MTTNDNKSKIVPWAIFIIASCILSAGCKTENTQKIPDCLYVRLKRNPPTLDPALIVDLDGARIAAKIYSGLVTFNEHLSPTPDIAESWDIAPDGLIYTFKLKQGCTFFNGRKLTASDIVYSFERVLNPRTRSPRTWVLSRIAGAQQYMAGTSNHVSGLKVKGPYELEITLDAPFAPFISFLGLTTAYIVPREEVEKWGNDYGFHGSGAAPFMLEKWQHNQFLVLRANKNHVGNKPFLAGIYYKIIPEDFTALVEFEKGDIDLLPEIMASEYNRYARDPAWRPYIKTSSCLNTYYLGLNCQMPPFTDVRVRRALNLAIDRNKMLHTIMGNRGILAGGPLPSQLRGSPDPDFYSYDPAGAKDLLREAGYPQGFSMTMYQTADIENLDICQVIQDYLKKVGIDVRIVQLEWGTFLEAVAMGEAQSFWLSWWADYPDAENFLFPLFHSQNWGVGGNRTRFKNDQVDSRIGEAVATMDDQKRQFLYRIIEKQIIEEAPWVFFWHKSVSCIHQPRVQGLTVPALAVMDRGDTIFLKDE